MPRPKRIEFPGAIYHVTHSVTAESTRLFHDPASGDAFMSLLAKTAVEHAVRIHAYCLLPNQYHLLLTTERANLSIFMRSVHASWQLCLASGEVPRTWAGRYRAWCIQAEQLLAPVSVYLHRQAEALAGRDHWINYRWSSIRVCLEKAAAPHWLDCAAVLQHSKDLGHSNYAELLQAPLPSVVLDFYSLQRRPAVLGSAEFKRAIGLLCQQRNATPAELDVSLSQLVEVTAGVFASPVASLYDSRRGALNLPRQTVMYLARFDMQMPLRDIAQHFNLRSHTAVCNSLLAFKKRLRNDKTLSDQITSIRQHLKAAAVNLVDVDYVEWY
jgi:putative transposase